MEKETGRERIRVIMYFMELILVIMGLRSPKFVGRLVGRS